MRTVLTGLGRRLTVSSAGRTLAADLSRIHGDGALGILDGMAAQLVDDDLTRDILAKAREALGAATRR